MKLEFIDTKEYDDLEAVELFAKDDYSRSFGTIKTVENNVLKFSWRSDIVKPEVLPIKDEFLTIGIDNSFAILNSKKSEVFVKLVLQWNFVKTITSNNQLYVVTEQSILIFSIYNLSLLNYKVLPDIIDDIEITEDFIKVSCMDGCSYNI
tara:strand:+ start:1227 stop:1676 length:450 start_codon:yes stop_codon:yes gene_type:complete